MSERYTRLFSLQENLYSEGAPIIIVAGAIQKDNRTGRVIGQLKFVSIADTDIKAVTVKISPYDTVGRTLGEPVIFNYLDLDVHRDDTFGDKTAIPFANDATRSYSVEVIEVVFVDKSIWSGGDSVWTPLPASVSLSDAMQDSELAKQYCVEFGNDCKYWPKEIGDLWYCTCGGINHAQETRCHLCEREWSIFESIDIDTLRESRDIRLKKEQEQCIAEKAETEAKARKSKKLIAILSSLALLIIAGVIVATQVVIPSMRYKEAESLFDAGNFDEAITIFESLGSYKDSANRILETRYSIAERLADTDLFSAINAFNELDTYSDSQAQSFALWGAITNRQVIDAGPSHAVGLNSDGTTIATQYRGDYYSGECDVSNWDNITAVSAGRSHTVGLRADGTVVAVGSNYYDPCNVSDWTNIVAISAGDNHTVGLRSNGTVVATGDNREGQCDVSDWYDIIQVSAGGYHTVGLKTDGTVVAAGAGFKFLFLSDDYGQCDVEGWSDIVAVSAGDVHTVGLRENGTVVATGYDANGRCDVDNWTDIVSISAGTAHTVGIKSDGTVVAVGKNDYGECDVSGWANIIAVTAGSGYTLGLQADGTVVATGTNEHGQCDVSEWTNIKKP